MLRSILAAAVAVSLPCCMTSCENFGKPEYLRTLKAAGMGALQGAIPAATSEVRDIRQEQAQKAAKNPVNVLP